MARSLAIALLLLAPVASFRPAGLTTARGARDRLAPLSMGNFFDSVGKKVTEGVQNAASEAILGTSKDTAELMQQKMTDGSLDFDDFLGQVKMMSRAGSLGSMASNMGMNLGEDIDARKLEEAAEKMRRYEKYVDVMSEEERKNTDLWIALGKKPDEAAAVAERIERVANDSGASIEDVNAFIKEFYLMKIAAQKFASGMSEEDLKREMAVEQQKMGDPMSRAARRKLDQMADSGTGSKKKKAKSKKNKLSELKGFS